MDSIWMAISPCALETRILATMGPHVPLLKARFSNRHPHRRAIPTLLEAVALWQAMPVRAVLAVDDEPGLLGTASHDSWLEDIDGSPLYTLSWVPRSRKRKRRHDLGGVGEFRDLERLLVTEVAR